MCQRSLTSRPMVTGPFHGLRRTEFGWKSIWIDIRFLRLLVIWICVHVGSGLFALLVLRLFCCSLRKHVEQWQVSLVSSYIIVPLPMYINCHRRPVQECKCLRSFFMKSGLHRGVRIPRRTGNRLQWNHKIRDLQSRKSQFSSWNHGLWGMLGGRRPKLPWPWKDPMSTDRPGGFLAQREKLGFPNVRNWPNSNWRHPFLLGKCFLSGAPCCHQSTDSLEYRFHRLVVTGGLTDDRRWEWFERWPTIPFDLDIVGIGSPIQISRWTTTKGTDSQNKSKGITKTVDYDMEISPSYKRMKGCEWFEWIYDLLSKEERNLKRTRIWDISDER